MANATYDKRISAAQQLIGEPTARASFFKCGLASGSEFWKQGLSGINSGGGSIRTLGGYSTAPSSNILTRINKLA